MWFTVYRTWDLQANERMVAFFKKELRSSHIINRAKKQKHYWTKRYRKFVSFDFPSARRYKRIKAIVSGNYVSMRRLYSQMSDLGKKI